jgi:uncharacterized protein (TIGR02996 family)
MSEEDAFLDGIAADRADRTRLLVFADWLADRSDPREDFVRLHARLLEMDGREPEFTELERRWNRWVGSSGGPHRRPYSGFLADRWLDAFCRLCTANDVAPYLQDSNYGWASAVQRAQHDGANPSDTVILYHGLARDFATPMEFLTGTILLDIAGNEWFQGTLDVCHPVTRGTFWRLWREQRDGLRTPPPLPEIVLDNHFLGAQYFGGGWAYWAAAAVYQKDCFALFWTTTD